MGASTAIHAPRARAMAPEPAALVVTPCRDQAFIRALARRLSEAADRAFCDEGAGACEPAAGRVLARADASPWAALDVGRTLLVAGPPNEAPGSVAELYGLAPAEALTFAAHCLAHGAEFALRTGAVVLDANQIAARPHEGAEQLAKAMGLHLGQSQCHAVADEVCAAIATASHLRLHAAGPLAFYAKGIPVAGMRAWWDAALFWSDESPDRTCPPVIDLTGRGRILAYGPFLAVPSGRWRAELAFTLDRGAAKRPYRLDLVAGATCVGQSDVWPAQAGRYEVAVEGTWSGVEVAQVRLWSMAAAFGGGLSLEGATFTWLGGADDGRP